MATEHKTLKRGIIYGIIGGLAGMIVMDIVMIVEFSIIRLPIDTYLELIGSVLGGGVLLGIPLHFVAGSLLGILFIFVVLKVDTFRIDSMRKGLGLGILLGVITIPFGCVPFAIITGIPITRMLYFSTIPHLVFGIVLGGIVGYGLRSSTVEKHN